MHIVALIMISIVAIEHIYILWMEMFAWTTVGRRTFRSLPGELFEPTKALAANQGLYNGFLSAGLIWSLCISDLAWSHNISLFFLCCVIVAGIYGSVTASRRILWVQALPAAIAGVFVLLDMYKF